MPKPSCVHHIHREDGVFPLLLDTPICIHCGLIDWERMYERCPSVTCDQAPAWRVRRAAVAR